MYEARVRKVAFDIGGTFTDVIILHEDGSIKTAKLLSLLDTVGATIRTSAHLGGDPRQGYIHGSTVAANALLEHKLGRVGLVTTEGFRDVLEMRSQRRPNIYDVNWTRPKSLISRELCLGVKERVLSDGSVDIELDRDDAANAVNTLLNNEVDSIAICLINSFVNGAHERAIAELVRDRDPLIHVSVSSEEFPEIREYERTSTTVVNAALAPVVDQYLSTLIGQLAVSESQLQIMQSNGGLMNAATARRRPVQMVESGPAAGVLAAARLAGEVDLPQVLAFDMGGTTAKATFIEHGTPLERPGGEVGAGANLATQFFGGAGHAIRVPAFDIAEVGAGGGSIAWVDDGGALRVGPEGAGADPGPVCYQRGGRQPTVTDANLVLGYLDTGGFAGGTIPVDRQAAADAILEVIAKPLGLDLLEAAHGIVQVANATTMRALRAVSIQRGIDPRGMSMIAFGGSGPVHAAQLASALGVSVVYVPPFSGIFSAVGLLLADHRLDAVRSLVMRLDQIDRKVLDERYGELDGSVRESMVGQGLAQSDVLITKELDIQYRGHDTALTLRFPEDASDIAESLKTAFVAAHKAAFGYERHEPPEIVSLRVRATALSEGATIAQLTEQAVPHEQVEQKLENWQACFHPSAGMVEVKIVTREDLTDMPLRGPAIVREWDTCTVVPPGWTVHRGAVGCLVLRNEEMAK